MATKSEGNAKQMATRRNLKNQATRDGTNAMHTAGGSHSKKSKRTLKFQAGVRDVT